MRRASSFLRIAFAAFCQGTLSGAEPPSPHYFWASPATVLFQVGDKKPAAIPTGDPNLEVQDAQEFWNLSISIHGSNLVFDSIEAGVVATEVSVFAEFEVPDRVEGKFPNFTVSKKKVRKLITRVRNPKVLLRNRRPLSIPIPEEVELRWNKDGFSPKDPEKFRQSLTAFFESIDTEKWSDLFELKTENVPKPLENLAQGEWQKIQKSSLGKVKTAMTRLGASEVTQMLQAIVVAPPSFQFSDEHWLLKTCGDAGFLLFPLDRPPLDCSAIEATSSPTWRLPTADAERWIQAVSGAPSVQLPGIWRQEGNQPRYFLDTLYTKTDSERAGVILEIQQGALRPVKWIRLEAEGAMPVRTSDEVTTFQTQFAIPNAALWTEKLRVTTHFKPLEGGREIAPLQWNLGSMSVVGDVGQHHPTIRNVRSIRGEFLQMQFQLLR